MVKALLITMRKKNYFILTMILSMLLFVRSNIISTCKDDVTVYLSLGPINVYYSWFSGIECR